MMICSPSPVPWRGAAAATAAPLVSPLRGDQRGFTLIEVIAVLILIGIVSGIAISRSGDTMTQADVVGATEVVKNHLRYAQTKAMNSDVPWGIQFAGSTYTLRNTATPPDVTPLPGAVPQGMTFAATLAHAPATVVNPVMFENRWGSPVDNSITPLTDSITVTVSKGGISQTITVTKNTGFIP